MKFCGHIAYLCKYDEGKTLQEIADMLGYKSRTTVMNMLKKAE